MNEKLNILMGEARLISASENVIFPLIDSMIHDRIELACGRYRSGKLDFMAEVAYVTALKDLKESLASTQRRGLAEFEKLNRENEL